MKDPLNSSITLLRLDQKLANSVLLECARTAQCAPLKHHFDECAERVAAQQENPDHKGPKEDCVEECEFFLVWLLGLFIFTIPPQLRPGFSLWGKAKLRETLKVQWWR